MTGRRRKPSPPYDQQMVSTRDISAGVDAFFSYQQKEKTASTKAKVSMKTVSQGMMDVSLLTSNASQLRTALLHPKYDFFWPLVSLILVSMGLQIVARVLMLWSDYLKDSVIDAGKKRKQLQFVALVIMSFITMANALISVFSVSGS
ncbi:ninjurin-1 isoform X2 [Magallana gigas]|uniref:ninjurin-1 isoform X2 n=1 Tax=Magallana gigas TaxID=29159 RepID=UPI00334064FD